jgi:sensor histidine kinase YesM
MKFYKVPSFLTTDPKNKQGEIGIFLNRKEDVIELEFSDGIKGFYMEDCLEEMGS